MHSLSDIHFGLSQVASYIRGQGHAVRLAVLVSDTPAASLKRLDAVMEEFQPEVVAFTSVSTQFGFVEQIAGHLRESWPKMVLVVGGVHCTLEPERAIAGPFDAVCVGEGELPLTE